MRSPYFALALAAFITAASAQPVPPRKVGNSSLPRPAHVLVVIEENKAFHQIINSKAAPYINSLVQRAALFTESFAITHPSQPNYLALFSGDTHGVVDDRCPISLSGPNLASELTRQGLSFAIYSESLPSVGYTGCESGDYHRKHNPAVNWQGQNVSPEMNLSLTTLHPGYAVLPTVSFIVPNQLDDMHDGDPQEAIRRGDKWLRDNIDPVITWADRNNALVVLTWDEDDNSANNHIVTMFVGPMVKPGLYSTRIDHYIVLRTLCDMYGLRSIGKSAAAAPITDIWITK